MVNVLKRFIPLLLLCGIDNFSSGQVQILDSYLNGFSARPESMVDVLLLNTNGATEVSITSELTGPSMEVLCRVTTSVFDLPTGITRTSDLPFSLANVDFGSSSLASLINAQGMLPAGIFMICINVTFYTGVESSTEMYCEEIVSDYLGFIHLVFPSNGDEIETTLPTLIWNHSEPFGIQTESERFVLMVSEMKEFQSPDEALDENTSHLFIENTMEHMVQYPISATQLEAGKTYAWRVQHLASDQVVAETETWTFTIVLPQVELPGKYATFTSLGEPSVYNLQNKRLYFKLNESYIGGEAKLIGVDPNGETYSVSIIRDNPLAAVNEKKIGHNLFYTDFDGASLVKGIHTLTLINAKGIKSVLKLYVE